MLKHLSNEDKIQGDLVEAFLYIQLYLTLFPGLQILQHLVIQGGSPVNWGLCDGQKFSSERSVQLKVTWSSAGLSTVSELAVCVSFPEVCGLLKCEVINPKRLKFFT